MIDLIIGAERHFQQYSAISWRPVSVMEEAGVPGENHRRRASNWSTLSHALCIECTLFVIYKAGREHTPYWW